MLKNIIENKILKKILLMISQITKNRSSNRIKAVPMRRLELPRAYAHYTLNVACLPISPHGLLFSVPRTRVELARRNRHHPLKVACLPISPPGL